MPLIFPFLHDSEEDWAYKTEPDEQIGKALKNGQFKMAAGKVLGGSSSTNAMLYLRGNKNDYDTWADMGNSGWDYQSILSMFFNIENIKKYRHKKNPKYGISGLLHLTKYICTQPIAHKLLEAAEEMGIPYIEEEKSIGFFRCYNNIYHGSRQSACKAYIRRRTSENLFLALQAQVSHVIIDPGTKIAKGIVAKIENEEKTFLASKEVILCAGSIESPHILMNSGTVTL